MDDTTEDLHRREIRRSTKSEERDTDQVTNHIRGRH